MSHSAAVSIDRIDAELPQTQCGKCGHAGCRPYAEAIAAGEAINRCPPGGEKTRDRLAALTGQPALPLIEPPQRPLLAKIREDECIGCTKCIQACPVDAILGAAKQMHTVIESECTGCELCVAPCPVDCIDLVDHPHWRQARDDREQQAYLDQRAVNGRRRFEARNLRLADQAEERRHQREKRARTGRQTRPETTPAKAVEASHDVTTLKTTRATLLARLKRVDKQLTQARDDDCRLLTERADTLRQQLADIDDRLDRASASSHHTESRHLRFAVAAAEQALRKAQQQLNHAERQQDDAATAHARRHVEQANQMLDDARTALEETQAPHADHQLSSDP